MFIKRFAECRELVAGDGTRLRELLHPDRDPVAARYSLAVARLGAGERSKPHRLAASEVYYFVRGRGVMHVGAESAAVGPGDAVEIPPGAVQWLENDGDEETEFVCIVDPAWQPGGEQVLE
jgi:mannose-6-phosphate isomerase-like protein (cupin superfamily)